jgi:hypothetical protein
VIKLKGQTSAFDIAQIYDMVKIGYLPISNFNVNDKYQIFYISPSIIEATKITKGYKHR